LLYIAKIVIKEYKERKMEKNKVDYENVEF